MLLNYFLTVVLLLSTFFALFSASPADAGNALMGGASAAVSFTLELTGAVCLWSAVMELLERGGAVKALTRLLAPLLRRLFPLSSRDGGIMSAISENVSANLLGLGNAATPMGIAAVKRMQELAHTRTATDEMCRLIVMNTASIQLLPTTVAAVRASLGAAAPFDILPAVWVTSALSVTAGLLAARLLRRFSHA